MLDETDIAQNQFKLKQEFDRQIKAAREQPNGDIIQGDGKEIPLLNSFWLHHFHFLKYRPF